jgi:hypothetical protein
MDAATGQHLRLPMQRVMPGELRDGDMCHQRCRRQSTVDWARRRRGLHHGGLTGAAAVFRPADALTRMIAGTMSSISLTSSPIRCNLPWQHGQMSLSGSMTTSSRGK